MRGAIVSMMLLVTAAAPVHGQVLIGLLFGEKLATPNFNMGFEIGINFATLDGLPRAERMNRTVFGLFADWRFSEHLHLGAAVLPAAGRGANGLDPAPTGDPVIDSQVAGTTMSRSLGYVELPVVLKWSPRRETGFRIGAGASVGLVTGATDRYAASTPSGTEYVLERDIGNAIPGVDLGLTVEAEWRLWMLAIAARYTHGLTDIRVRGTSQAVHSRVLTGTGRIYLGRKRPAAQPVPG